MPGRARPSPPASADGRRAADAGEACSRSGGGAPAGVAHGQRQRRPAGEPAELDDGRRDRRGRAGRPPGCPTRPVARRRARSTTRSAYCTTRSSRCSASTTVRPRSWTSRCRVASTSSAASGSSAEVGSSSTSTRGCVVSTDPIATRCCCPPDRSASGRLRTLGQPEQVEGLLDPLAHHVGGQPERLHAVGELVLDGVGDEPGQRVLPDEADDVGEVARPVGRGCRGRRRRPGRAACRRRSAGPGR